MESAATVPDQNAWTIAKQTGRGGEKSKTTNAARRRLRAETEPKPAKEWKTWAKTRQKTVKKAEIGKNGARTAEGERRRWAGAATWNFVISESESLSPVWVVGLDSAGFWTYSTTAEFCAGTHCACRNANVTGRTGRNWVRKFDRNHRAQDIKQTKGD